MCIYPKGMRGTVAEANAGNRIKTIARNGPKRNPVDQIGGQTMRKRFPNKPA